MAKKRAEEITPVTDSPTRAILLWPDISVTIPAADFDCHVSVSGTMYSHVDEVDGVWRFRAMNPK